tara:strand:- start:169 stop:438 length:270 start_codon:yes stop_codon:yes gene_type:complete
MNWEMKSKFTNVVKKTINDVNYFAVIKNNNLKVMSIFYQRDGVHGMTKVRKYDNPDCFGKPTKRFQDLAKHFEINRELKLKLRSLHDVA